jgi:hypothetical protein
MTVKCSAYLNIFNDWEFLPSVLPSIAPYIDELVVVDGAYQWMVPYLEGIGIDPRQSNPKMYSILESSKIPFRTLTGIWKNQLEKRIAGYQACQNRFVFRIDSDEVAFFNNFSLTEFLFGDSAVAKMEVPMHYVPGYIIKEAAGYPRAGFLFDKEQISPEEHLNYLWLVLTADERPVGSQLSKRIFSRPIAYCAHLSLWRIPQHAVHRAAYYTLNWSRKFGFPFFEEFKGRPITDFNTVFNILSPKIYHDLMYNHPIVVGYDPLEGRALQQSPLSSEYEEEITKFYDQFMVGQLQLNTELSTKGRPFHDRVHIDLSTESAREVVYEGEEAVFFISSPVSVAKAQLLYLTSDAPWETRENLDVTVKNDRVCIKINRQENPFKFLRRILILDIWCKDSLPFHLIKV